MDFLIAESSSPSNKENNNLNKEISNLTKSLNVIKFGDKKKQEAVSQNPLEKVDDSINPDLLFPANISDESSEIIIDHSIKTSIKILSTRNMDWINSVTFNHDDNEIKESINKALDYYTYPAKLHDLQNEKQFLTQYSSNSTPPNYIEVDKEWFASFKDWYIKWLSFDDSEGSTKEFSLITKTYKVKFVSKGVSENGKIERKRYAIVANPSKTLLEKLSDSKIVFETYKKPNSKADVDPELEISQHLDFSEEIRYDELNLININLTKESEPVCVVIRDTDVHVLMNALLNLCIPYFKEVKLVAQYSFCNSVHRTAEIQYKGKVLMRKAVVNSEKTSSADKEPTWYSVELTGMYTFDTVKNLAKLFTNRIQKNLEEDQECTNDELKVSWKTAKSSESLNWISTGVKSVHNIKVNVSKEDNTVSTKYYVKFN